MNNDREIANTLLEYLSSNENSVEEKVDFILELLNRANYQCDNIRKYSLALLRNSMMKLDIKKSDCDGENNYSINNMYALFGENNTFFIARESSYSTNARGNARKYTLFDVLSRSCVMECDYYQNYSSFTSIPWKNGSIQVNNIQYYVIPIANIIPAKYITPDGINFNTLQVISDTVSEYLAYNPLFIKEVFMKKKTIND